ncbi:MAG: ABC transporter ATP-binding protein [Acidobacteriaceae bacterium]|nr:ABC transporter ATP-binding protein [Acidobacteriaceae bacterium]MBV9779828.1 ABC transporter ATP-binding protein [Acidobacteriaceae bacterium]
MALIDVRSVGKIYRSDGASVTALKNVSLEVNAGDFIAVVGRSGCGKSTLLNLCGAMDFPTTGEVIIEGRSTTSLTDAELTRIRREKAGFVFQSFQLLHTLSAVENVELPLLLARKPNARQTALARLCAVEMEQYADRLPHQLSGGEQQRVAIARALVHSPRVILADEPTGNLDSATSQSVLKLLLNSTREFGVAVIMATHSTENIFAANRIVRLHDGRIEGAMSGVR